MFLIWLTLSFSMFSSFHNKKVTTVINVQIPNNIPPSLVKNKVIEIPPANTQKQKKLRLL